MALFRPDRNGGATDHSRRPYPSCLFVRHLDNFGVGPTSLRHAPSRRAMDWISFSTFRSHRLRRPLRRPHPISTQAQGAHAIHTSSHACHTSVHATYTSKQSIYTGAHACRTSVHPFKDERASYAYMRACMSYPRACDAYMCARLPHLCARLQYERAYDSYERPS